MKKILLIQFRARPDIAEDEVVGFQAAVGAVARVSHMSALDESRQWHDPKAILSGFDAVILGGSGDLDFDGGRSLDDPARVMSHIVKDRLAPLVRYVREHNIPLLGVCFGHQLVAEVFGVPVVHDHEQQKIGTHPVALTPEGKSNPLFTGMPDTFMAQYGHKDSLSALPEGARVLVCGERCRFSALAYGPAMYTMYTVQFHPELTEERTRFKLAHTPGYLPEGVDVNEIVKPSPEASTLVRAFIERIVA